MKHDKVFLIPERMSEFVPDSPSPLPWKRSEAFIGVPLFSDGKCFAHYACIWSLEGAAKRKLSWTYIEMFLHSLEDLVLQRILEGRGFAKQPAAPQSTLARVIPLDAITASQSLKPHARSLSHELRTPMQGVVGMLEIMHSTVAESIASQESPLVKSIFEELRSNIELVQGKHRVVSIIRIAFYYYPELACVVIVWIHLLLRLWIGLSINFCYAFSDYC
jgi:hypothetical protein